MSSHLLQNPKVFWNVLLGEKTFYGFSEKGGDILDILQYAELNKSKIKGTMNQFLGIDEKY